MCYDKKLGTKEQIDYARVYGNDPVEVDHYRKQLDPLQPTYYETGFDHLAAPVITNVNPKDIQFYNWGLMPWWCKDSMSAVKISNTTLNARGETIFEKPAFKDSAKSKRCLITCVDGFYEHYHQGKTKYPFFIYLRNNEPMTFAGLWDRWEDKHEGIIRYTYSIVTTKANKLMSTIHNNPAATEGPRMPVILPKELMWNWLKPIYDKIDKEEIQSLIQPYPDEEMTAYPVHQLKGKNGTGNKPEASEKFEYPDLKITI